MSNEGINTPRERGPEERLLPEEFFELQYSAAKILSEQRHIPLEQALFTFTSFPRKFGLTGDDSSHPQWQQYLRGLVANQDDPVAYTYAFYKQSPAETQRERFGCFGFDSPTDDGVIRIHFKNTDTDGEGPLSSEKIEKRKRELKEMFTHIKHTYPQATTVQGGSWLYSREEYRRLFPTSFGDSRQPFRFSKRTQGMHYWGQFLDHNGQIRPELAEKFLDALKHIDEDQQVVEAFPERPYLTESPIEDFYKFYGIE